MAEKTPEQMAAEARAAEANKTRNDARIARMNAIADNADEVKVGEEELEDLTDEKWDQEDPANKRKTREELIAEQDAADEAAEAAAANEEDSDAVVEGAEAEDRDADAAREAGADDVRKKNGVTEYQVNGKWLTLTALRALAGHVEDESGDGQGDEEGATRTRTQAPDPAAAAEARRKATETAQAEAAAYKARLKELYTKASMGDEEAIDQLAEIQAGLSRVTPDVLRIVDERVDARVTGRTAFNQAVEWFEDEYADELATPALKAQAARRDRDLAQENPDMAPRVRLKKVGEELRQLRIDLGGKPRGKPAPTKQQRKAAAEQVPAAAGRQRPEVEPDEVQSTSDAIAQMAKGRGQARAIKH